MNISTFQHAAGINGDLAARWFVHIEAAMEEFGIEKPVDQAMFIAQIGHESQGYQKLVESLNYSVEGLLSTFSRRRISAEMAAALGRTAARPANQPAIANQVYGGEWGLENLGNTQPGDGWEFRGRGLKQITGRSNYTLCGEALGVDLIASPSLLERDPYAARSAAWFYVWRGCLKHPGDIMRITRLINGGENGLADRKARYVKALAVLTA